MSEEYQNLCLLYSLMSVQNPEARKAIDIIKKAISRLEYCEDRIAKLDNFKRVSK